MVVEKDTVSGKWLMLVKTRLHYDSPVMPGLMLAGSVTACSSFRQTRAWKPALIRLGSFKVPPTARRTCRTLAQEKNPPPKKNLHRLNFESPTQHHPTPIPRSEVPGNPTRRINLLVGGVCSSWSGVLDQGLEQKR